MDTHFIIHGGKLVRIVLSFLLNHLHVIDNFCTFFEDESIDESIFNHILKFLFGTYSKIHRKDVTRKIITFENYNVKLYIHQKLTALFDVTTYMKKK